MSVQTEIDRIIGAVEAAHTAIAGKGGTTARPYLVGNLADAINTIPASADPKLQAKTVSPTTSSQTIKPDSGYDALSQVTVNAMPTATQATPSISVSSGGLITASATQSAGYVAAGTKSATKQLTVQAAQTITPGTADKTIASGRYLSGTQTIKGDSNLKGDNIKSGVSIFGVSGTFEGSGGGGVGEFQTATGSFRPTSADMSQANISITGLGFQPKYISIVTTNNLSAPPNVGSNGFAAMQYHVFNLSYNGAETMGLHIYRSSSTSANASINSDKISRITLTTTADGFEITGSRIYWFTLDYQYFAVG